MFDCGELVLNPNKTPSFIQPNKNIFQIKTLTSIAIYRFNISPWQNNFSSRNKAKIS